MNDWDIKKFIKIVLAIQFAMWGAIGMDAIGFQIPLLRPFIGSIYLLFLPGILILRILKIHKLSSIETMLYSVGLSITTLMFIGFFINLIFPFFGISSPLSISSVISSITIVVLMLSFLSYVIDKDFSITSNLKIDEIFTPPFLFLLTIPFVAIFGTFFMNIYQNNIILMLLIVLIVIIVVLVAFDKFIPNNMYPLAVFIISASLVYHSSLISTYLWGWDIQQEFYHANNVFENSIWDSKNPYSINAMLSIVMLAPIFSIITNMSLTWVLKIIYPFLLSLIPLGLYLVYKKQTNDKIAFFACFLFISFFGFYSWLVILPRQLIAEFFLVLLILLFLDNDINKVKRSFLSIIFSLSLIVSHYGISYIYMFMLFFVWIILTSIENSNIQSIKGFFYNKFYRAKINDKSVFLELRDNNISSTFVILFITFTLMWYINISGSSSFNSIVMIGNHIIRSLLTDFLNPEVVQGLKHITENTVTSLHNYNKYIHIISQLFIVIGITTTLFNNKTNFTKNYIIFSIINFGLLIASITVPFFALSITTTRLYQITLIFLSPFFVIGFITVFNIINTHIIKSWRRTHINNPFKVLSLFLVLYLMFNSGFIYEIGKDIPSSISLNNTIDYPTFNEYEFLGAKWLFNSKNNQPVYSDMNRNLILGSFEWEQVRVLPTKVNEISQNSYTYFGSYNLQYKTGFLLDVERNLMIKQNIDPIYIVDSQNKIYDNSGTIIGRKN